MELDFDFVREVLIFCADSQSPHGPGDIEMREFADKKGKTVYQLAFTINRLYEAGYIKKKTSYASGEPYLVEPGNLTWDGNEYLNNIRNQSIWNATKEKVKSVGGSVSLSVMGSVAAALLKQQLGL